MRASSGLRWTCVFFLFLACSCFSGPGGAKPAPPAPRPLPAVVETTAPAADGTWSPAAGEPAPRIPGPQESAGGGAKSQVTEQAIPGGSGVYRPGGVRQSRSVAPSVRTRLRKVAPEPDARDKAAYARLVEDRLTRAWAARSESRAWRQTAAAAEPDSVELRVSVSGDGAVSAADVVRSSGRAGVDKAVLDTALRLRGLPRPPHARAAHGLILTVRR